MPRTSRAISVRVPLETIEKLKEVAQKTGSTQNSILSKAIELVLALSGQVTI
ncbi:MAG: ribbon-helix-helix domain-containing protein [Timaviella obliquedivisa GSE-PSE-MK23-08B]|jgi:predicted DNA-binding protein|nr:ribbon-helix-helix domain-containing protein [Timaviella obliquedivisa GSE-PSE-MK23-08B]